MYVTVYRGKIVCSGTQADCEYYGSGLASSDWAVMTQDEFYQFKNQLRGENKVNKTSSRILANVRDNTVSGAAHEYLQRPLRFNKRRYYEEN